MAELKGGKISVYSEVDKGTVFTFTNWYEVSTTGNTNENLRRQISDLDSFDNDTKVLLVEDNKSNQYITREMLKKWNIKVDIAVNGLQAIEKLIENNYDLILMDMHMPVMDGYEATRRIREEMDDIKKHIPILSFSAAVVQKERDDAKNAGVDDIIEKPFEPENLHNKIKKLINEKKMQSTRL